MNWPLTPWILAVGKMWCKRPESRLTGNWQNITKGFCWFNSSYFRTELGIQKPHSSIEINDIFFLLEEMNIFPQQVQRNFRAVSTNRKFLRTIGLETDRPIGESFGDHWPSLRPFADVCGPRAKHCDLLPVCSLFPTGDETKRHQYFTRLFIVFTGTHMSYTQQQRINWPITSLC